MTQLANKTILITGGASGIGRQVALRMARQGGRIVLWDLDQDRMAQTVDEVARGGDRKSLTATSAMLPIANRSTQRPKRYPSGSCPRRRARQQRGLRLRQAVPRLHR